MDVVSPPSRAAIAPWRRQVDQTLRTGASRATGFCAVHWLGLVNGALALLVLLATAGAVVLHLLGADGAAAGLVASYHLICAQAPGHTYRLFGQELCLCQRCLAIYSALLLGGLFFPLVRGRLRPIGLVGYAVLCLPMAIDGFTQHWGWWQSDWAMRTLTGALFGLGCFWYLYPAVDRFQRYWHVVALASPATNIDRRNG